MCVCVSAGGDLHVSARHVYANERVHSLSGVHSRN